MSEFLNFAAVALPEIIVGMGICIVLLAGMGGGHRAGEVSYLLALATLVVASWATVSDGWATLTMPGGAFVVDPIARVLKLFVFGIVAVVLVYARAHARGRRIEAGEYYVLALFGLLGIMVMISAASFLTMYLGLETLALSLYAMVALERDSPVGAEAAMKYFVLGAIASGCLLYGISLIYGVTGSIAFSAVNDALQAADSRQIGAIVGLVFIVVGIAFKFGAVPFHMWVPDVYQGAPVSVTLFVSTAPEIAAFALMLRMLIDGLVSLEADWQAMLAWLAVLSLAIGNLTAIVQTNIKRMLAYSTIAHVGFILLGFLAGRPQGVQSALFYTLVYVLMTSAAFGIVILLSTGKGEADQLDDMKGLNRRSPWFAAMMLLVMVSMIGVPPLAGFYAKWWVLAALLDTGHTWLAVIAVVFSVIGAFYYLRIIWLMYFEEGASDAALQPGLDLRILLSANALVILALGISPGRLLDLCSRALAQL